MKILAINGSYRGDQGHTAQLIGQIFEGALSAGADCEVITLSKIKINHCLGCLKCQEEEFRLHCVYEDRDDVKMVFQKMSEADLIMYASPVYIFGISGLMKIFLDRLTGTCNCSEFGITNSGLFFHHIDHAICSKPFVTLVCCDNLEDETPANIIAYFKTFSRFMDAEQVGTIIRKSGKIVGLGVETEKEKLFPKLTDVNLALNKAGNELATLGRITVQTQKRANAEILAIPSIVKLLINFRPVKEQALKKMYEMSKTLSH